MTKYWDIKPVCPHAHNHRHIRQMFKRFGKAGIDDKGEAFVTVTNGDPCTWRVAHQFDFLDSAIPFRNDVIGHVTSCELAEDGNSFTAIVKMS